MPEEGAITPATGQLTLKQLAFVKAYLANRGNGTQAAIEAGYSKKSAHAIASENLRKPAIVAALQEAGISTPTELEAAQVQIAFAADPADFEEFLNGTATLAELRSRGVDTRLVKRVSIRRSRDKSGNELGETRTVEFYDRQKALASLQRLHGAIAGSGQTRRPTQVQAVQVHINTDGVEEALRGRLGFLPNGDGEGDAAP